MKSLPERFDWSQAHDRLGRLAEALDAAGQLAPEEGRKVMDLRAMELAHGGEADDAPDQTLDIVAFALDEERFALETRFVREVLRVGDVTPLPGAPPYMLGVMNLRGEILPLVDLRLFFHLTIQELSDTARVMILGEERAELGVVVDEVDVVSTLKEEDVHPAPGSVHGKAQDFLLGVTADALLVLDGDTLLNDPQLIIDDADTHA